MQQHFATRKSHRERGFSFVELLVTAAVIGLVFGGLLSSFQTLVAYVSSIKVQTGAVALAQERMEFIRSLTYNDVGTLGGIPGGNIPQNATTSLNGVVYQERIVIQYVDAPDDGQGALDSNGILADYKQVKVEYSWDDRGETKTIALLSNIVPRSIETTTGGGTITVKVFDANVAPVSGASVRVINDSISPTIDTTRLTNVDGIAIFSGAPAGANYAIEVTKAGFSSDGTLESSIEVPSPNAAPTSVLESEVSTMFFAIDVTSELEVWTMAPPETDSFFDTFDTSTSVSASSSVAIGGDGVTLAFGGASYDPTGSLTSTAIDPPSLTAWSEAAFDAVKPLSTEILVSVYYDDGIALVPIPDADLPGNSTGFASSPIDISGLDPATYPTLALYGELATADSAATPELLQWEIAYVTDVSPIASVDFTMTGSKSLGLDSLFQPVPKYDAAHVTDGTGNISLVDLEWDTYDIEITESGYTVAEVCNPLPFSLAPGISDTLTFTLVPSVATSLRVAVVDINGVPVSGATAHLENTGVDQTELASSCGGAFFSGGLFGASDYTLTVSASGFVTEVIENVTVGADSSLQVVLSL